MMEYVFGPVPSRRLGHSLGINVVPHKICSFDCLYCEVGKTTELTLDRRRFFDPDALIDAVKSQYAEYKSMLNVVTLTGAGEPTLNVDLEYIIDELKTFVEHPLAILTNSSLIDDPDVQDALMKLDIVVPSLDAVSTPLFLKINKPHPAQDLDSLCQSFVHFSNRFKGALYPEVLILKGINDAPDEIDRISKVLSQCSYELVHLNTAFRPAAYKESIMLNDAELLNIAMQFRSNGIKIEPAAKFIKSLSTDSQENTPQDILKLLGMRPCTFEEVCDIFGLAETQTSSILNSHLASGALKKESHAQQWFYSSVEI